MLILKRLFIVSILTLLTQVGGIIYLVYLLIGRYVEWKRYNKAKRIIIKLLAFFLLFFITTFFIIPPIAKHFGRVALPIYQSKEIPIKPATIITCFANRHYVSPKLLKALKEISKKEKDKVLIYLDANFPFIDGFPLLPHKSHSDGKKVDISFRYFDKKTKKTVNHTPTLFGYGFCESPQKKEYNQAKICKDKGYWQYDLLKKITRQNRNYIFDKIGTKQLLLNLIKQPEVKKIFIEPHLKQRLNLSKINKIRFHGCGAVRHDDHIHIQL